MRNPFSHHEPEYSPEQIDQAYEAKGWGVKVERRVERPSGGESLYFQLRLPNGTVCTDIADLAEAATDGHAADSAGGAKEVFTRQTDALRELGQAPGVVLLAAVFDQGKPAEPLHTLTVLYTSLTTLPKSLRLSEPDGWKVVRHDPATRVSRHVMRDLLLLGRNLSSDEDAEALIIQQYALATDLGSLVVTFTNWRSASGRTLGYYDDVVKTVYLGEEPAGVVEEIK